MSECTWAAPDAYRHNAVRLRRVAVHEAYLRAGTGAPGVGRFVSAPVNGRFTKAPRCRAAAQRLAR